MAWQARKDFPRAAPSTGPIVITMLSLCILADVEPVAGLRNASTTSVGMFQRIPRKQLPTSKDVVLGVGQAVCGRGCLVPSRAAHGRLAFPPNQTRAGGDIGNISTCTDDLAEAMTLRFPLFWREQYRVQVQRLTCWRPAYAVSCHLSRPFHSFVWELLAGLAGYHSHGPGSAKIVP